jgi:hypothetical protein
MALPTFGEEQHRDEDPAEHANGGPTKLLEPELLDRSCASGVLKPPTCGDGSPKRVLDHAYPRSGSWPEEPLQSRKWRERARLGHQSRRSRRIP